VEPGPEPMPEPVVEVEPEPEVEAEPAVEVEPAAEAEAEEVDAVSEADEPDVASPSLQELASDVTAVTEDPEREVEDEPEELPPAAAADESEDQPEAEEEVTIKSVETVSAIDLVMEEQTRASKS
jgi:pilus assembly protein FimV